VGLARLRRVPNRHRSPRTHRTIPNPQDHLSSSPEPRSLSLRVVIGKRIHSTAGRTHNWGRRRRLNSIGRRPDSPTVECLVAASAIDEASARNQSSPQMRRAPSVELTAASAVPRCQRREGEPGGLGRDDRQLARRQRTASPQSTACWYQECVGLMLLIAFSPLLRTIIACSIARASPLVSGERVDLAQAGRSGLHGWAALRSMSLAREANPPLHRIAAHPDPIKRGSCARLPAPAIAAGWCA
jgi:hypothetical protein